MAEFFGLSLPSVGTESECFLESHGCRLRFGSSLALMALVAEALNESDDFGDVSLDGFFERVSYRVSQTLLRPLGGPDGGLGGVD